MPVDPVSNGGLGPSGQPERPALAQLDPKDMQTPNEVSGQDSFSSALLDAVDRLNEAELGADQALVNVATGSTDELAGAIIQAEKANLAMGAALSIRKQALEAYNKIMQMPV